MKVSIITPTYNRANFIQRCIQSVLDQNYDNFEMIIIDDGSIDHTDKIISRFLSDSRIKYFKLPQNSGVNKARNFGLEYISEDTGLITFLDSDDEFFPTALTDMIFEAHKYSNINCFRFGVIDSEGIESNNSKYTNYIADYNFYIKNLFNIGEWVCTFRKSVIDKGFRYNENVNGFELISYLELAKNEKQYFSNKIVRLYHVGHESITNEVMSKSKIANSILGYKFILDNYGDDIYLISRRIFARLEYIVSYFYILEGKKRHGFNYNLKAFCTYPFDLRFFRNIIKILQ